VRVIDFYNRPELLFQGAAGVVSMAGYNTFCEILSFDRPALLVPRVAPRKEQWIRARRARDFGLVDMLLPHEAADPAVLARHLRDLPDRPGPMAAGAAPMLDGIDRICAAVRGVFESHLRREVFLPPAAE
jgi:predicted glycosyltransferase